MRERTLIHRFSSESCKYSDLTNVIERFEAERFPEGEERHSFFRVSTRPSTENHAGETTLTFLSRAD